MRIQRCSGFIGFAGLLLLVGVTEARGQAPPDADALLPAGDEPDAAARGLRSLYIPDGLTAERAVEEILRTSPDVQRTRALSLEAKGGAVQAMSGLVPRLELVGRATKLSPVKTAGIPGGDSAVINARIDDLQDEAAQDLWRGLFSFQFPSLTTQYATDATLIYSFTDSLAEALPAYRAAKKNKKAAQQQLEAELNDVAFGARQAYYEFARAKAGVGVAESAVAAAEAQRKDTAALVNAGAAARVDLLRVAAQLEAANVALERAKLGFQVAQRALQTLMHTNEVPTLGEDLSEPVTGIPSKTEDELKERALVDRPDLQALYTYVEATRHQLKSANGGRAPDLLVRGSAQYSNPNLRVVPQQERFEGTWEVSAVIRWAPNDTVAAQGRSKQLQAALQRAEADVIALGDAIRVEVAEGYHGVRAANAALKSAGLGLAAAEEGYRVKREQLRAGIVNTTDLLQSQSELIRAQVDVVDSAVGLRIAKAQLLRAIGSRP
ncbi:MAG: TolC family protein [Myxococcales bacterium]|nr:TolC family protein [Myxococcales bacterium]MDH3484215.1 TolC family protein [Myxococcales bacterium]